MSGWRRQIGGGRQKKTFYLLNLSQTLILQWQVLRRRLSINWTYVEWLTACLCLSMCLVLLFTFCIRFKGGGCISRQWRRRRKAGDCVLSLFVTGTLKEANSAYLYLINECCGPNWPGRQQQPTEWVNAAAVAEKDNLCLQYLEIHLKRLCWWSQGKWMQFNLLQTDIVHSNECPSSPHLTESLSLPVYRSHLSLVVMCWWWRLIAWLVRLLWASFVSLIVVAVVLHVTDDRSSIPPRTIVWMCIQGKHVSLRTHHRMVRMAPGQVHKHVYYCLAG